MKAQHSLGLARQVWQAWWFNVRYGLSSDDYYSYQLYRPERRRLACDFVPAWESITAINHLTPRTAPHARPFTDKRGFEEFCSRHHLPFIPTLAVVQNGEWTYGPGAPHDFPACDLFVKPTTSWGGRGARRLSHEAAGRWRAGGVIRSQAEWVAALGAESREKGPLLVQPRCQNHPDLRDLTPGSLCTVRLVTAIGPSGGPAVVQATYRMPTGNSAADNFDLGGLASEIDVLTGELQAAIQKDPLRITITHETHPDTGGRIAGRRLPCWNDVLALGCRAHELAPRMPLVGWDIAITSDGPLLVEANRNPCARLAQMPGGVPLSTTRWGRTLNEHFRQRHASQPAARS